MPPPYPTINAPLRPREIEAALADLATTFPDVCSRITLPHPTAEGRVSTCLRIAQGIGPDRAAALIIGGVHAREWAPPDALISFARNLLVAYQAGSGIRFPAATVAPLGSEPPVDYPRWEIPADHVESIVRSLDLYIFPLVNPDGREYDLTNLMSPGWRKNRSPQVTPGQFGVDINRNFDIIWKFENYYDMPFYGQYLDPPASIQAADDTYRGLSAASEAETKNVAYLLDALPIHYFMDVHMFGRSIQFSWGIEGDGDDPSMTFRNPRQLADGLPHGDLRLPLNRVDYQEYLPDTAPFRIRSRAQMISVVMRDAILNSAGASTTATVSTPQSHHSRYKVEQSFLFYASGPTSGSSDDFACSLQFIDPNRQPIFAFTLEVGDAEEGGFHCDYSPSANHFAKLNRESQAAITAMLVVAARNPISSPAVPTSACLIATATMGDPGHPDVVFLRSWRDDRLRSTQRGARFADLLDRVYYSFSPAVARYLDHHGRARTLARVAVIRPVVVALRNGLRVVDRIGARPGVG